jgi:hypothetical protein
MGRGGGGGSRASGGKGRGKREVLALKMEEEEECDHPGNIYQIVPIAHLFAWGEGDRGHLLRETTSRGLCGQSAHHDGTREPEEPGTNTGCACFPWFLSFGDRPEWLLQDPITSLTVIWSPPVGSVT